MKRLFLRTAVAVFAGGVCWCATATGPILTNATVKPGGVFQADLLTVAGQSYTVEVSTNLIDWRAKYCYTNVSNQVTVVDRTVSQLERCYYRARTGTAVLNSLSFVFSAYGGAWAQVWIATPVTPSHHAVRLAVENDTDYPAGGTVWFTGPPGSGVTNLPASGWSGPVYQVDPVWPAMLPSAGLWNVTYKGTNLAFSVPDSRAASRMVVPLPQLTNWTNGNLQVDWVYRDAVTGGTLSGPPDFLTSIQTTVAGYASAVLPPSATTFVFTEVFGLPREADVIMTYQDDLENTYAIKFSELPP